MSIKALVIALVLLILMSVAGVLLLSQPAPKRAGGVVQLLPTIQPERVQRIEINGFPMVRDGTTWRDETIGWPLRADLVRNMLRALSGLSGPEHTGDGVVTPRTVTLTMDDGTVHTITADARGFSGKTYAVSGDKQAEIPLGVLQAMAVDEEVIYDLRAMPNLQTERINELTLSAGGRSVRARKRGAKWFVDLGDETWVRADAASVRAVIERFRLIDAERVRPESDLPIAGAMGDPLFAASLVPSGDDASPFGLRFFERDQVGDGMGAIASLPSGARAYIRTDSFNPDEIPLDPVTYSARTASDELTTNVRTIVVTKGDDERRYRRTLDGWVRVESDGPPATLEAEALLSFVTSRQGVPGRSAEAMFATDATVALLGDDDGILQELEAGYIESGVFVMRSGPVSWAFPRAEAPALLRLSPPRAE